MANLSNINGKFLFTDGDFLKIGNLAPINNASSTESGVSITNSNVASIALTSTGANGKTFLTYTNPGGDYTIYDISASSPRLTINTGGDATFAGTISSSSISAEGMITVTQNDIGTGESVGLRIIRSGGAQIWNITSGLTGVDNTTFNIRNSTNNTNVFSIDNSTNAATFAGNVNVGGSVSSPASVGTILGVVGRNGVGAGTAGIVLKDYDNAGWDIWNSGGVLNFRYNNGASGAGDGLSIGTNSDATFAGNLIIHNSSNAPYIDFVESGATTDSKARITMDQIDTNNGQLIFSTENAGTLTTALTINQTQNSTFAGDIMPAAENLYDIGSASVRWEDIWADQVYGRDFYVDDYIYHNGDTNTYIRAQADQWTFRTGGDDRMHIDNTGVGIGTTSPETQLSIGNYTDSTETITIATSSDGTGRINFYDNNNTEGGSIRVVGENGGSKMYFSNRWNTDNDRVIFDLKNGIASFTGQVVAGTTSDYTDGVGAVVGNSTSGDNGGFVDTHTNGAHRYYTRIAHGATGSGSAGYWHIKTNISMNDYCMFLAKFYGYIYGQAAIVDLQHGGYAYGVSNAVINQATTNNSSNSNMSSAIYLTAANQMVFRIDMGVSSGASTYYAGLWMDIGLQNPTGGTKIVKILGSAFSATANYYT